MDQAQQDVIARRAKLYDRTLNRLAKWRTVLTGWMIGTAAKDAPGVQGLRDVHEQRLIQRVELNALAALLIEKGIITTDEYKSQIVIECDAYQEQLAKMFPGYLAHDSGIQVDTALAVETNKRMGFPP